MDRVPLSQQRDGDLQWEMEMESKVRLLGIFPSLQASVRPKFSQFIVF